MADCNSMRRMISPARAVEATVLLPSFSTTIASGGDCGGEGGQQYGGLHGSGRRDHAAHGIAVGHRGERRVPYLPREEDARRQGTDCVWVATAGACARHFAGAMELC